MTTVITTLYIQSSFTIPLCTISINNLTSGHIYSDIHRTQEELKDNLVLSLMTEQTYRFTISALGFATIVQEVTITDKTNSIIITLIPSIGVTPTPTPMFTRIPETPSPSSIPCLDIIPEIGTYWQEQGGYYFGKIYSEGKVYGLILGPDFYRSSGEIRFTDVISSTQAYNITKLTSFSNGKLNTQWIQSVSTILNRINTTQSPIATNFTDWYLPSLFELELLYRTFKPTEEVNATGAFTHLYTRLDSRATLNQHQDYQLEGRNFYSYPIQQGYTLDNPVRSTYELENWNLIPGIYASSTYFSYFYHRILRAHYDVSMYSIDFNNGSLRHSYLVSGDYLDYVRLRFIRRVLLCESNHPGFFPSATPTSTSTSTPTSTSSTTPTKTPSTTRTLSATATGTKTISATPSPSMGCRDLTRQLGEYWPEQGGYYVGRFNIDRRVYALILNEYQLDGSTSIGTYWTIKGKINKSNINGVSLQNTSLYDGQKNTRSLLEFSRLANEYYLETIPNSYLNNPYWHFIVGRYIDSMNQGLETGHNNKTDWYLPSFYELELCYRVFKPTSDENTVGDKTQVFRTLDSNITKANFGCNVHREMVNAGQNFYSIPMVGDYTLTNPSQTEFQDFRDNTILSFNAESYWTSTLYQLKSRSIPNGYENYPYHYSISFKEGQVSSSSWVSANFVRLMRRVLLCEDLPYDIMPSPTSSIPSIPVTPTSTSSRTPRPWITKTPRLGSGDGVIITPCGGGSEDGGGSGGGSGGLTPTPSATLGGGNGGSGVVTPSPTATPTNTSTNTSSSSSTLSLSPTATPTNTTTETPSPTTTLTASPVYRNNIWSCGTNNYGQLGLGDNIERLELTQLIFRDPILDVYTGNGHVIILDNMLDIWGWGYNGDGRLSLDDLTNRKVPELISSQSWISLGSGLNYFMAIKEDGSLWVCGNNYYGQLGIGDVVARDSLVRSPFSEDWKKVSCDERVSCLIKTDGSLWACGNNEFGGLGISNLMETLVPLPVGSDHDWELVNPGENHTVGIKSNGTLWVWGNNEFGQLGLGDTDVRMTPTQLGTDTHWKYVKPGISYTIAVKTDGTLWAWGKNNYGQLGLGDKISRNEPVQVGSDTNWKTISTRWSSTMAIKTDGTLWAWGYNYYGQLGLGDKVHRSSPVQVGNKTSWKLVACGVTYTVAIES